MPTYIWLFWDYWNLKADKLDNLHLLLYNSCFFRLAGEFLLNCWVIFSLLEVFFHFVNRNFWKKIWLCQIIYYITVFAFAKFAYSKALSVLLTELAYKFAGPCCLQNAIEMRKRQQKTEENRANHSQRLILFQQLVVPSNRPSHQSLRTTTGSGLWILKKPVKIEKYKVNGSFWENSPYHYFHSMCQFWLILASGELHVEIIWGVQNCTTPSPLTLPLLGLTLSKDFIETWANENVISDECTEELDMYCTMHLP